MRRPAMWRLAGLSLLLLVGVWRPDVLWTAFFAPGVFALGLMAFLPADTAARITYGIHPEGGAASAIPLVGMVSIGFWGGLVLAWWAYSAIPKAQRNQLASSARRAEFLLAIPLLPRRGRGDDVLCPQVDRCDAIHLGIVGE